MEKDNKQHTKVTSDQLLVGQNRSLYTKIMAMILGDGHLEVAKRIYENGNGDRLIQNRNQLAILMAALVSILGGMIIIVLTESDFVFFIMFMIGVGSILIAFLTVLKRWIFFSEIEDYLSSRVKVDKRYEMRSPDEKNQIVDEYLGMYFSPLTTRIMSIGVIPIIAGIVVIILSDLSNNPSATKLFQNTALELDVIFILLLLGGATEALAFFFGFLYPDTTNKKINVGYSSNDIITSIPSSITSSTNSEKSTITRKDIEDVVVEKLNNVQVTASIRTN